MTVLHSSFSTPEGIREDFFAATGAANKDFLSEATALIEEYDKKIIQCNCSRSSEMLLRLHLSDVTNQIAFLEQLLADRSCFISIIGQPPADGRRIALEAWHWSNANMQNSSGVLEVNTENYQAFWYKNNTLNADGSFDQTYEEFSTLGEFLKKHNANVADNTVRTWLYNRDVDNNYAGLVKARNKYFAENGLTKDTHFIASTGIEGQNEVVTRLVKMDSLNYQSLQNGQMRYLTAPEYLSPTAIYGVSFERGTRLVFGDRSHYFISGTASIDKNGNVVHCFDTALQTHRLLDNIQALLESDAGAMSDIKLFTIYLRDVADADIVRNIVKERLGEDLPLVTLKAPVCRPAWLVEIECIAINNKGDKQYPVLK